MNGKATQHPDTVCLSTRALFSSYLDGAVSGREMQAVAAHLDSCPACTEDFAAWRAMQAALTASAAHPVPANLGLQLRVAISQEAARRGVRWRDRLQMRWENLVRPALLQVSAGLAGTVVLLGGLTTLLGAVAVPQAVQANDEPLGALTAPRYSYSVEAQTPVLSGYDSNVVIDAKVNAEGLVYDYTVLSGPTDAQTLDEVRHLLLLQVYTPARVFGAPVNGHVLVTFSGVEVRG